MTKLEKACEQLLYDLSDRLAFLRKAR